MSILTKKLKLDFKTLIVGLLDDYSETGNQEPIKESLKYYVLDKDYKVNIHELVNSWIILIKPSNIDLVDNWKISRWYPKQKSTLTFHTSEQALAKINVTEVRFLIPKSDPLFD